MYNITKFESVGVLRTFVQIPRDNQAGRFNYRLGKRTENMDQEVEKSNKLYVGNLPYNVDDQPFRDEQLKAIFAEAGEVSEATVITERETGRSKGFGFVTYADEATATKALEELNGKEIGGRELRISYARPMREREDR